MKKAIILLVSLFAMMAASTGLKAQEVTILLRPGWNWIGYPYAESVDLENAFGDFQPMNDDVIQSFWGYSEYVTGYGWFGGIDELQPGWGYMYYSNRTEAVIVELSAPASQTMVSTSEPTNITAESAVVGGTVTVPEGTHVFLRGVCWGTEPNPDIDGDHTTEETGIGSFSSMLEGLNPNTIYYVRAYVVSDYGLAYGNEVSFTTIPIWTIEATPNPTDGGTITGAGDYEQNAICNLTAIANEGYIFANWTENGEVVSTDAIYSFTVNADRTLVANFAVSGDDHAYVDLGLPSGLLWATCNVGADSPEDYGDYFAWGETQPKDIYNWSTYQYANGTSWQDLQLTKYCNNSSYGYNGFTDNLTTLLPEDDAATANWGNGWRMPTQEEWQELYNNTTVTWTTQNGVNGRLFTASNGNSLFLPAAGDRYYSGLGSAGSWGDYWSSSLYTDTPGRAWRFYFSSDVCSMDGSYRYYGFTVRPVCSAQNTAPTGAINGKFTINYNGGQVYFSQGNLQYIGSAATPYWKFADNQWDVLGTNTGQNSGDQNVDRDLFGWGTSGYHDSSDPYNVNYQPWSTFTSQVNSNYNYYGYGPSTNMTDPNLTGTSANYDWGVNNPISNGGNQANQWRTLTQPEWEYIFNTRTTSSGIRYAKANVNNVNGVILLPDDWNTGYYSLSDTNSSGASYSSNTISVSQWSSLEQHGAAFLPAAGGRNGASVNSVGIYGDYWSASYGNSDDAWGVGFLDTNLVTVSNDRYYGRSVRLVASAEN